MVVMKSEYEKFVEISRESGPVFLRISKYDFQDEGTIMIVKTLMEDLSLSDGDEINYTLHRNIIPNNGTIRIEFIEKPREENFYIDHDINVTFRRRFRRRPINNDLTYHFKYGNREYKFKVVIEEGGYVMPIEYIYFTNEDKKKEYHLFL